MTTLVTGATGFIGSHLLDELLARGVPVRALVRDPARADDLRRRGVDAVVGDIRRLEDLSDAVRGASRVLHCAAAVGAEHSRRDIYDANLAGVRHVLEAARRAGVGRVVLVSSVNVLGTRNIDPATEDLPCRRSNDPAADVKIEAERAALEQASRGADVTVVRPGFVYGPRDGRNLPRLVSAVARGAFRYIGGPHNVVPIVHVSDLVQALLLAAEAPAARGRVYHVTDGSRTTIGELAGWVAELLGRPPPRRVVPFFLAHAGCVAFELLAKVRGRTAHGPINRAGLRFLGTSRYVDITRARRELGYTPKVGWREGIASAVREIQGAPEEPAHAPRTPA